MGSTNGGGQNGSSTKDRLWLQGFSDEYVQAVLASRAESLARNPERARRAVDEGQYVTFRLDKERYGINILHVEEIQPMKELTLIPCTPKFIAGAMNIRGNIMPIVDVKQFFNIPQTDTGNMRIIVIDVDGIKFGLMADAVDDVVSIDAGSVAPQLATFAATHEQLITGITDSGVIILDLVKLAGDKRLLINESL